MEPIRVAAKAIIVRDGRILLTENRDHQGVFYLLPGGGQHHGESLGEAVARECQEEIACRVVVRDVALVRDYIAAHHEFANEEGNVHQIEIMFLCQLADGEEPCCGAGRDGAQTGVAWLPLADLARHRVYPAAMIEDLILLGTGQEPRSRYLGDVN